MMRITFDEAQLILNSPDLGQIIGSRAEAFKIKWQKAITTHKDEIDPQSGEIYLPRAGIIWWAFLLGPLWLLHRKLYKLAFIWMGINFAFGILENYLPALLTSVCAFAVSIVFLLHSGEWYLQRCRNLFHQGQALTDPEERAKLYADKGGTSPSGWIVGVICLLLIIRGFLIGALP